MSTYRHVADSAPYYDDYVDAEHEDKGYVKVLWKPSRAVQARELTQMQTYAQKQTAELGGYLFKDGTVVHGGVISTTTKQKYFIAALNYPTGMSLNDAMAGFMAYNKDKESTGFNGLFPQNVDSTSDPNKAIQFQFVGWETFDDPDQVTTSNAATGTSTTMVVVFYNLFGNTFADTTADGYVSSDNKARAMSMSFRNPATNDVNLNVTSFFKDNPADKNDIYLTCTRAFCNRGTIFVDGYFVNCPYGAVLVNSIEVSGMDGTPTIRVKPIGKEEEYHIGFWINRKIVDAYEDPTLTDPASGTYNHKSSGADRYSILANLICLTPERLDALESAGLLRISSSSDNSDNDGATEGIKFVTGIIMKNNIVVKEQSNIGTNSELMDEIARRTYEESGNYTVNPWKIQIENLVKKDDDGFAADNPTKYEVAVNPGLGYIYGYRVSTCVSQKLENDRARKTMIRPKSMKYTEKSLSVLSADVYTPNNSSSNPVYNINSRYIDKVLEAGRIVLLNRQISELLKTHEEGSSEYTSLAAESSDENGIPEPPSSDQLANEYANWTAVSGGAAALYVLGTAVVSSIAYKDQKTLQIWILDVSGVSNLSDVSSIASLDESGRLTGYIDLQHQGSDNVTVWNAVEEPLIFETDWQYIAKDAETYAKYVTETTLLSSGATVSNSLVSIIFEPAGTSIPTDIRQVNYLLDKVTGMLVPLDNLDVSSSDPNTNTTTTSNTNSSFYVYEKEAAGTLTSEGTNRYLISYQTSAVIRDTAGTTNDIEQAKNFKTKTLCLGVCIVTATELNNLVKVYGLGGSGSDVLLLTDNKSLSGEDSFSDDSSGGSIKVTDLVKILAIEKFSGNYAMSNEVTQGTAAANSKEELYYNSETTLASSLAIDDGCRDYCYQQASIKGLGEWFVKNDTTITGTETAEPSTNSWLKIVFAYWKHKVASNTSGFYYAGSYTTHKSVQFSSIEKLNADIENSKNFSIEETSSQSVYKKRLADWYGVKSILSTVEDSAVSYSEDAWKLIPKYKAKSGAWYDLSTCFDFRPDWFGSSRLAPSMPQPATLMEYKVATYLPRIDTVWVDKDGTFGISQGTPSDNPIPPKTKDGTLVLYNIYNKPYGKTLGEIVPEYIDNHRHTMIDITAIANRLANLEEVVSLSMAEQSAVNMQIVDEDGMSRYKCGIFTDSFGSFENCGYSESEWSATIDTVEKCIRPDFDLRNWGFSVYGKYVMESGGTFALLSPMIRSSASEITDESPADIAVYGQHARIRIEESTASAGGEMVGGTVLTIRPLVNPEYASDEERKYRWLYAKNDAITETMNVQSVMFVVWNGNLTLTPAIDTWTNDLGELGIISETWEDSEQPPDAYRSWTTTTDGTVTQSTVKQTLPSGITYKDLDKLYGKSWREVPKSERVTHLPGWWEPATTLTEVATYKTVTATKVTEKTTYTGSWQANDVSIYMESQDEYMRVRKVKFDLQGMRPNQTFKAAMDNVPLKLLTIQQFTDSNLKETEYLDEITTNSDGCVTGYFVVPENMPVGTKVVEFFDGEETSAATAEYTANGKTVWTNTQRNYIRVWTAETSQTYGESSTTIGKKIDSKMVSTATAIFHNEDPIAESFYIEEDSGVTLESIDVFFAAKDPSVGVELFIVECENGYPGQTVVPFSRVFVPSSSVNVTSKSSIPAGGPTPTNFKFPVPLQLQGGMEYAFVVIAPSYSYELYTSTLGKADLVTGNGVREQPYTGTMYKSQNLRTWTAESMSDIAFRIYRYKFPVNTRVSADFVLDDLVSRNTGIDTTLPQEKVSTEDYELGTGFFANSMTISAGTYIPSGTSIKFYWYAGGDNPSSMKPFENKQDIFLSENNGMPIYFNYTNPNEGTSDSIYVNNNTAVYVRAELTTSDTNIAPQIDLEDFCGIFTRNKMVKNENGVQETMQIDSRTYCKAGTYLSNTIALKDPAIGLKVAVDAMLPGSSVLKAYFKSMGMSNNTETVIVPALSSASTISTVVGSTESSSNAIRLPGAKLNDIDPLIGKRSYIWLYVKDSGDSSFKLILPHQMAYYNSNTTKYSHSSCILEKMPITASDEVSAYQPTSLIVKDPVNLNILPTPSFNYSVEGNSIRASISWDKATDTTGTICGVFAMPLDEEYGIFDPDIIPKLEKSNAANYAGIVCNPYSSNTTYYVNDICLYDECFWKCVAPTGSSLNNAPANDVLNWEKVPCLLFASEKLTGSTPEAKWMELTGDNYNQSTERETNFMEYSFSTVPAMELNEFDSFILKIDMWSLNTKDIPRFRNLRAVAIY